VLAATLLVQACTNREVVNVVARSIEISPANASLLEGETLQFDAVITDDHGESYANAPVQWTSDDPAMVAIDSTGLASAMLRGSTKVRATYNGEVSDSAVVVVLQTAGIAVSQASGPTTEAGGTATFTVVLESEPSADVTIALSSSDASEGDVGAPSLSFSSANWDAPQVVTVSGREDDVADGNVSYTIVLAAAVSADPRYDGLDAADVLITNNDNDVAGIVVSPVSGPTTEAGGIATFTVVLTSQPIADVVIGLSSSDTTEGTLVVTSLTFTPTNWDVAQTVVVTGHNDSQADGNITYAIVTASAASGDLNYQGLDAADVSVTNVDDETAGFTVSAASGPTSEAGGQATFSVVLNAAPTANVTVGLSSSDLSEGTISASALVFTPINWNAAQTVTVTGQDDDADDGDILYAVVTSPATSTDAGYNGLNAADISITNVDDETAGVFVSSPSGPTTEAGGSATFIVALNSQPTGDVTLSFSSDDASEGVVSTGPVTFTTTNWSVPRTVTVVGQDDALADGNIVYSVVSAPAVSADPLYSGLDPADVQMTNVDNETAGIAVSPASGPTAETGGQVTFTVVLNTEPTGSVTIGLTSSDLTEGTVSPASLTFTSVNWNVPRVVTVTGQNDAVDDGDIVFSIVTLSATSSDPNYNGLDAADVSITNIDDDIAGVRVSPISGPTTEAGGTATFTVVLDSEPLASVSLTVTSSDLTEGLVTGPAGGTLTFTPSGPGIWSAPQTVSVQGQDDVIIDPNTVYTIVTSAASSTDPRYNGLVVADVQVTNVDNETAGITVSAVTGPTTEGGGQALFTVVLNNQPSAGVTIGISSSDPTEGTVSVGSLTFTTANWNTPQTVTISGQNDFVDDDNVVYTIVTAPATSTDMNYNGINAADVSVTNVDDDTAGITVSAASGPTTESGGQATFTIRLNSEPTADVTVGLTSNDLTEGTVSPSSLTFTPSGANIWSTPRTVTVTGVNDPLDDDNVVYQIVTAAAVSTDSRYNGMNVPDVTLTNVDDDVSGITVSPASGPTTEASGTATFTVVLNTQPSANVTIGLSTSDPTEGVITSPAGGSLTFAMATWNTPQSVTVTGQNDAVDDGDIAYSIITAPATSTDTRYNGVDAANVSITNTDDDQAGISVSPASGPTTEAGGTATFTLVLTSEPTAAVTINVSSGDPTEGVVTSPAGGTLTFNPAGAGIWSIPQTVTVTGQNDPIDDDNVVYAIVTSPASSADPAYNGLNAADVSLTNVDDETAGVIVSPISGPTTETGGTVTFTVVLATAPAAPVTIALSSSDPSEGLVTSPAGGTLTFNPSGPGIWSTPQTVTVTGQNDPQQDGNIVYTIVTAPASSTDPSYSGLDAADVSVTNIDDETAGISVTPISGPTTEDGGTATFTVILSSQPTANVAISVASDDASEGVVTSPAGGTLTFTNANWSTPQTVTVTGQDDFFDDGNIAYVIVTSAASSSDAAYNGINPPDVSVTNVDDDVAGVTVSPPTGPTTEDGGIAQFTLVLNSQPTATVSIALVSSDATEGVVTSSTPIQFNNSNWSAPQTITVQGQDDEIDDDNVPYTIITAASAADPLYDNIGVADVPLTNVDDADLAGINVAPTAGLVTTETGGTAEFTVVLNSEPTVGVSIAISSSDPTEGQVTSATPLLFNAGNWNTPQTVTVTGQDDAIDDGTVAYTIITASATSGDVKYNGRDASDVSAVNSDDADTAGIIVSPTSGLVVTESGGSDQFTIVLTSEPVADVTISVTSSDTGEATVGTALLTFTPTAGPNSWNAPHVVTATGVNDNLDDGNQPFTIITGPATSTDPLYTGMVAADVTGSSIDIHAAALAINDATVLESAGSATFTATLSVPSTETVTVNYATLAGTATAGADYTTTSGTLTFVAGDVSETITVPVLVDALDEADETYTVTLSGESFATIADGSGLGTITDDDPLPALTIGDATVLESAGSATFTVTLSAASGRTVTVNYATVAGTATAGADYTTTSGTLTFVAGDVSETITVPVLVDALDEDDETYTVTLSGESNATIADGSGLGTITDDDPAPTISIDDVTVTEGSGSTVNANFTISLSAASGKTVTVQYATADGTGTAGADYTAISLTTVTFHPGSTVQPVVVVVQGDLLDEVNETVFLNLSNPSNAGISDTQGVGTITDDDPPPALTISDASVLESAGSATFTVTLSAASGRTVTVNYMTVAGTATAGADYTTTSGMLTFVAGDVSETITVPVLVDALDEDDETYTVTLSGESFATIADGTGLGTITDDDTADFTITESGGSSSVLEATGADEFEVVLTAQPASDVVITIVSADTGEVTVGTVTLTFTTGDWDTPQVVDLFGVADGLDDGDQVTMVTVAVDDVASDDQWDSLVDKTVSVTTVDID